MSSPDTYGLTSSIAQLVGELRSDAESTVSKWSTLPDVATFDVSVPVLPPYNRVRMDSYGRSDTMAAALLSVYAPADGHVSYMLIPQDELQPDDTRVAVDWFGRPMTRSGDNYFGFSDVPDPDQEHFLALLLDVEPSGVTRLSGLIDDVGMVEICKMPATRSDAHDIASVGLDLASVMSSVLSIPPTRPSPTQRMP